MAGRTLAVPRPANAGSWVCIFRAASRDLATSKTNFATIYKGVTVGNRVFVGPHVCFTNDRYPRSVSDAGEPLGPDDWAVVPSLVKRGAAIGANATIVCGVTVGEDAMVGAGSTIVHDVPAGTLVVGTPGRVVGVRRPSTPASDALPANRGGIGTEAPHRRDRPSSRHY